MPKKASKEKEVAIQYDLNASCAKLALYEGEKKQLPVFGGHVTLDGVEYHISFNLPDGSVIAITSVESRDPSYSDSLFITDLLRYGKNDLSAVCFKSRYELLDLTCSSMTEDYGFAMFGGRCIAPYVFIAINVGASSCVRCQDPRVMGYEIISLTDNEEQTVQVIKGSNKTDETVDSVENHPPVVDEAKKLKEYKPLIKSMINKLSGKWKDVNRSRHQPSLLPYDRDDLMQFGLMQAVIAIRKYKATNPTHASEFTFVFKHLWSRFGQLAVKYSKQSRGYGVVHHRDYVNDEGTLVCAYDQVKVSDDE